jgi:hypothetical protein
MRRCIFALMIASVAALGQEQPPAAAPSVDVPLTLKGLKNALHGMDVSNEPGGVFVLVGRDGRVERKACAVPLLVVPVDPNIDPKISIGKKPAANIDRMPIAQGLPPCAPKREERPVIEGPPSP